MPKHQSLRDSLRFIQGNNLVIAVTDLLGNFSRGMVVPYASLYVLALQGDVTRIGLVNSISPLAGLLMLPIAGHISDRASRVRLVALGNYFSAAVLLLYVLAPRWEVIALAALLQGFAVFQFPARSALLADSIPPEDRGRAFAAQNTLSWGLAIPAPYIGGAVVDAHGANWGLRALFGVMMIANVAAGIINARFLKEIRSQTTVTPQTGERLPLSDLPGVLRDAYAALPSLLGRLPRSLKALTGVIVLSFVASAVIAPFWVIYAMEQIGLSPSAWGLILLGESILKGVMFVPAGVLVDRWGRTTSLLAALLISLVCIPLFVLTTGFTGVLLIRLALAVAFAIGIPSCSALMADTVPRDVRGRVMAALGQGGILIGSAGGVGGPGVGFVTVIPLMLAYLAGGYLYDLNPAYPWFMALGATASAILLIALFIRDPQQAEV
jgi:MFS family permease